MKNLLYAGLLLLCTNIVHAQSTINIKSYGGTYATEQWINIEDATGNQVWGQGDGTYGNGAGLIDQNVSLNPGTYTVHCYDKYADSWNGSLITITAYGNVIGNNNGESPDDGTDTDLNETWEDPAIELEASFTIIVPSAPSCAAPSNFQENNILDTSVLLSWNPGGSESSWIIEYGPFGFQVGSGTSITTTSNSYSLTGLTPNTDYDYYIRSDCGSELSSWAQVQDFKTIDIGYTCELAIPINSLPYQTQDNTANYNDNYNGTPGISCSSSASYLNGDDIVYKYTPSSNGCINVNLNNISSNYTGVFLYNDCANIGNTCLNGDTNTSSTSDLSIISQAVNANETIYIVISTWATPQSTSYELVIEECASCPAPYSLSEINITPSSADIFWLSSGTESFWNIEYGVAGFLQGSGTMVTSSQTNYSLTNLNGNTTYDYYVQADCGSENSIWVKSSFSTNPVVPGCGDKFYDPGGPNNNYPLDVEVTTIICPENAGEIITVEFVYFNIEDFDELMAYNGNNSQAPFIGSYAGNINVGTIEASNESGCLTFVFISDDSDTEPGWEADVSCSTPSGCSSPTNLSTSNITFNSADLSWNTSNGESAWNIEYGPSGYTQGNGTQISVTQNPYTLSGLTSGTNYDFYVQANCGSDVSNYSSVASFITSIAAPSNDLCTDAIHLDVNPAFIGVVGTNVGSTPSNETPIPQCGSFSSGEDVWYSVTVPADGSVIIECKSNNDLSDLAMQVYSGSCGNLSMIECDDDDGDGRFPMVDLNNMTPGSTLFVRVYEYGNNEFGTFKISAYSACDATTIALNSGISQMSIASTCQNGNWTYYRDSDLATVLAIDWGLYNDAAKNAAIVTLNSDNSIYQETAGEQGTFVLGSFWNVDIGNEILAGDVSLKFYYDAASINSVDQLAQDYADQNGSSLEQGVWFKTVGTEFDPASITHESIGQGAIELSNTLGIENGVNYVLLQNISSFSGGGYAAGAGQGPSPLPIELISFDVEEDGANNVISWTTASEKNSELTRVQKSHDGRKWNEVDIVYSTGEDRGDSYKIIDDNPYQLTYYRLETLDFDGTVTHSPIVHLKRVKIENGWELQAVPNPTNHNSVISLYSSREEVIELIMTDISGKIIMSRQYDVKIGGNEIRIDLGDNRPGTYLIKVSSLSSTEVLKLLKF